jgi:fructokinase
LPPLPVAAVVFGEALVDFFPQPDEVGRPLEEVGQFRRCLGGAPANFAIGLARQGIPTALVSQVGSDAFGRFVQSALQADGVACDGLLSHASARTGVTFVSLHGGGRSFLFYRHPSADMLIAPGQVDEKAAFVRRGRLLHFGSSTLSREPSRAATLRAIELACGKGAERPSRLLSCDVNLRPHLWPEIKEAPPILRKLLADCDIVKLVPEELPILFGTDNVEEGAAKARKAGATVVAVTLGESGCYVDSPAGQAYFAAEPIVPPARLIDPTGAGDAFSAGLIGSLLLDVLVRDPEDPMAGDDLRQRLRSLSAAQIKRAATHASHLGALSCTALGATTALPKAPPPAPLPTAKRTVVGKRKSSDEADRE